MQARVALAGLVVLSLLTFGCGPNARRVRAVEAVESTRIALTELEATTSGGDAPLEVHDALDRANVRLEETEHALDLWAGSRGSLAFERMAACLSASLDALRSALAAAGMAVSVDLETAEVALGTTTDHECAHRTGGE